jgi:hypothetical protein
VRSGLSRVWSLCRRNQRASAGGPPKCAAIRSEWPPRTTGAISVRLNPAIIPRLTRASSQQRRNAAGRPQRLQRQAAPHQALKRDSVSSALSPSGGGAPEHGAAALERVGPTATRSAAATTSAARRAQRHAADRRKCDWTRRLAEERRIFFCCGTACSGRGWWPPYCKRGKQRGQQQQQQHPRPTEAANVKCVWYVHYPRAERTPCSPKPNENFRLAKRRANKSIIHKYFEA